MLPDAGVSALDVQFLFSGAVIGFSIAAPVGPIGMLCIRTTLEKGRLAGFAAGLGAATADALYGCLAALGLTAVTGLLESNGLWLRLGGGLLLIYLGLHTVFARAVPTGPAPSSAGKGVLRGYGLTFFLTLTNPMTIIAYGAILAGAGVVHLQEQTAEAVLLIAGVFLGSALWWLLLSSAAGSLRGRMSPLAFLWINRGAGAVIAGFGVWMAAAAIQSIGG